MKVYKFLALNKIREKVRLIRNMYIPIVGLIIFLAMVLSIIGKDFFNIIKSIKMFDSKIYFISFLCMLASIICKMRKNSMPQIVVIAIPISKAPGIFLTRRTAVEIKPTITSNTLGWKIWPRATRVASFLTEIPAF